MARRWESWAVLDYGDHGLAAARSDPSRVGYVEIGDTMRWSGQDDTSWEARVSEIVIRTPRGIFGLLPSGLELESMEFGSLRIRARSAAPGVPLPRTQAMEGEYMRTGSMRRALLRRGARFEPHPPRD